MQVKDLMKQTVLTVTPKSSFKNLWKILFQNKINALPVVDSQKKLLGIITKEDLLKKLYPDYLDLIEDFSQASDFEEMEGKIDTIHNFTALEIMNHRVILTREDTPAMRALSRMIARNVDQLPVVNDDDVVIGFITKGDIFYALFRKHQKFLRGRKQLIGI